MAKEKELLKVLASINKVETMSDKTLKLQVFTTRELNPDDETKIMRYRNREGVFVFSPQETGIIEKDIQNLPKFEPEFKTSKSPSERLRNVLYVFYTQTHEWKNDATHRKAFEDWRIVQMEKFIETVKSKLKPSETGY